MKDNKKHKNDSDNDRFRKGLWSVEEDKMLLDYVNIQGKGHWNRVSKETGLKRSGKSCRLRWMNYLSPSVKRERFTEDEDDLIVRLHNLLGNRWALIAGRVPGRTDNQVKNYWNTHLSKKLHINKKTPANYCKPAIIDNHDHLPALPTDDQIISSDFSTNTTSCAVRIETANKETKSVEESNTDAAQKSPQLGGPQADTFGQTETAAADDDDHSSWFIQYLDDYSLHFVLNSNHRNNAAGGNST